MVLNWLNRFGRDSMLCNTRVLMLTSLDNGLEPKRAERLRVTVLPKPIRQSRLFDVIVSLAYGQSSDSNSETVTTPKQTTGQAVRRGDVLIADDNEINRVVASELVMSVGFRTKLVANGLEAVKAVAQSRFDLVLMDCEMPEMDGFAATHEIRRLEAAGKLASTPADPLPIIALTAQAVQGDRQRCLDGGMTDYVTKPINRHKLFESVNASLADRNARHTAEPSEVPKPQVISQAPVCDLGPTDDLPSIDLADFTDRCMGKPKLVTDLLQMFSEAIDERAIELSKQLVDGDITQVVRTAHSLKGMSANVSAIRVHRAAAQMETAARAGQSDDCRKIELQLLADVASCQAEIGRLLKGTPEASSELV